ncbi:hypothetical protein HGRIS_001899 [Hohenbuehelia grisea]|uniref:Peptidase S28 n=1 Tax=Hohenbuehelia grisea TaxID=104357 RepID=A0ABR3JJ93_9AGAR
MDLRHWKLAAIAACLSPLVQAILPDGRFNGNIFPRPGVPRLDIPEGRVIAVDGTALPPINTTYYFEQLIDHNNPSRGTFWQRYWHTWEFYKPGGPIVLNTPGEFDASGYIGYVTNRTFPGMIAQQENGATIVLEHRFFGLSNPIPDLSAKSLKLHTIQQAIDDLEYFARNVKLPMPGGDQVAPGQAPWILTGGSYPGALTAYTMVNKPGLFHIGYASSAVVQNIMHYWRYFEPIRTTMPRACARDVQAVIEYIDRTFRGKNQTAIQAIKDNFGLGDMIHLDDVAGALRNNLWRYQELSPISSPNAPFHQFCNALQMKDGVSAPPSGWGRRHALEAWGKYWRTTYLPQLCGSLNTEDCLGTYDTSQPWWSDIRINNNWRSWFWIVCHEVGFFQNGAPRGFPTIVSRLTKPEQDIRQCQQMFPNAFPSLAPPNVAATNTAYKGWRIKVDRLFFANGLRDPWRGASMSAKSHHVPLVSTPRQPIAMAAGGYHCSDLLASFAVDPTVDAVQKQALASIKTWMTEWQPSTPLIGPQGNEPAIDTRPPPPDAPKAKPINAWFREMLPI